jgi:hypothetical protein
MHSHGINMIDQFFKYSDSGNGLWALKQRPKVAGAPQDSRYNITPHEVGVILKAAEEGGFA